MPYWAVRGVVGGLVGAHLAGSRDCLARVLGAGCGEGQGVRSPLARPFRTACAFERTTPSPHLCIKGSDYQLCSYPHPTQPTHSQKKPCSGGALAKFSKPFNGNGNGSPNAHHTHTAPYHTASHRVTLVRTSLPHSCPHPHPHLHHDHPPTPPPTIDNHHVFLSQ